MKGGIVERQHDGFFKKVSRSIDLFLLLSFLLLGACGAGIGTSPEKIRLNSDHFDGDRYFNPDLTSDSREESRRGALEVVYVIG